MEDSQYITILGGGLAGLATGFYAKKKQLSFTILEKQDRVGGYAITIRNGTFLFDAGAHFFFDKNPQITTEIAELLGKDFQKVCLPVQIYHDGVFIDFPLSSLNLLRNLGLTSFIRSCFELAVQRLKTRPMDASFASLAMRTYGKTIAESYFINHSQKQWGLQCSRLSSAISGGKLRHLNLKTLLVELLSSRNDKRENVNCNSYYPSMGIGMIAERLAEYCGNGCIVLNSQITKINHKGNRIRTVEINADKRRSVNKLVSTLPLNHFLRIMEPEPPNEVLDAAKNLSYRDLILVVLFLKRESIKEVASIHFPDIAFPVTRIHEPKNRSIEMAPVWETSLVAEIPCVCGDIYWRLGDAQLIQIVGSGLSRIGLFKEGEIKDGLVFRMHNAYPVLELGYKRSLQIIFNYLKKFNNLAVTGRSGSYKYISMHHVMEFAKELVDKVTVYKENHVN